jgi:hypothetical protein
MGCVGSITLDTPHGAMAITALGPSQASALTRAALLAEYIAGDPTMMAMLPRNTISAIAAIKRLSTAAMMGPEEFQEAWQELRGPGQERLARALHIEQVSEEVGILPLVLLAAKYGPTIANAAHKLYKERQAAKKKAKEEAAKGGKVEDLGLFLDKYSPSHIAANFLKKTVKRAISKKRPAPRRRVEPQPEPEYDQEQDEDALEQSYDDGAQ